jgi:uncharacterized protein YwgA
MVVEGTFGNNQDWKGGRKMKILQRQAIILSLIEKLLEKGSWCGETHIQKSAYFLQELLNVPLGFEFILYKYGPFSFDLGDELISMQADDIVRMELRPPYGPSVQPGPMAEQLKNLYPKTLRNYEKEVLFVANELGEYKVGELESIATALYVTHHGSIKKDDLQKKASYIREIKPHISQEQAISALQRQKEISDRACAIVGR